MAWLQKLWILWRLSKRDWTANCLRRLKVSCLSRRCCLDAIQGTFQLCYSMIYVCSSSLKESVYKPKERKDNLGTDYHFHSKQIATRIQLLSWYPKEAINTKLMFRILWLNTYNPKNPITSKTNVYCVYFCVCACVQVGHMEGHQFCYSIPFWCINSFCRRLSNLLKQKEAQARSL